MIAAHKLLIMAAECFSGCARVSAGSVNSRFVKLADASRLDRSLLKSVGTVDSTIYMTRLRLIHNI